MVLLETARARVHNPSDAHRTMEVRLLLDGGSQRSYITDRVRKLLALEPSGKDRLSIAAFGSHREKPRVCSTVNVGLAMKGYPNMHLSLFVVPMICEPLAGQPISACIEENRHLASLDLADFSDGTSSLEVDILIGSDYYWSLVTGGLPWEQWTHCHPQEAWLGVVRSNPSERVGAELSESHHNPRSQS